jgi:hypothetical protein
LRAERAWKRPARRRKVINLKHVKSSGNHRQGPEICPDKLIDPAPLPLIGMVGSPISNRQGDPALDPHDFGRNVQCTGGHF